MIRAPRDCRVVFDGQSHTNSPDPFLGHEIFGWAWTRIVMLGRALPAYWVGVGGTSLTGLASNFATRAAPYVTPTELEPTIYVLCGGTQDVLDGDSGAQIYADAWALADLARAAGADYVIATTILPATGIAGDAETRRLAANAAILADASSKFDQSVDLEVPGLDDPTDLDSYIFDGTHIWGFPSDPAHGTGLAAALVAPALDAGIAAVTP